MKNKNRILIAVLFILGIPLLCQLESSGSVTPTPPQGTLYPTLEPVIWFGVEDHMKTPYP